jgi:hypothetical protein
MPSLPYLYQGIVVPASVSIPLVMALVKYRQAGKPLRIVLVYLIIAGITNGAAAVLAFRRINNLPLLHIYTIVELILLGLFFFEVFNNPVVKKWVLVAIILFSLFCVINLSFFQSIFAFNTYPRSLEAIILIIFSALYFYKQTDGRGNLAWWNERAETWIVIGIVLYFSSALIQFSFSNIVSKKADFDTKMIIWNIHASLVLIMYLLFAAGFAKCKKLQTI